MEPVAIRKDETTTERHFQVELGGVAGGYYQLRGLGFQLLGEYAQQLVVLRFFRIGFSGGFCVTALLTYRRAAPVGDAAAVHETVVPHVGSGQQPLDDKWLFCFCDTQRIFCAMACDDAPDTIAPRVIIYAAGGAVQVVYQSAVHFCRAQYTGRIAGAGAAQSRGNRLFRQLRQRDDGYIRLSFFFNVSATAAQAGSAMVAAELMMV